MMEQPSVTLEAPRLLQQNADLVLRATFTTPGSGGEANTIIPQDASFHLRQPSGQVLAYTRTAPTVRLADGALQLAIPVREYGDWYVAVQGTTLYGGQRVRVRAEALVHVAASAFA